MSKPTEKYPELSALKKKLEAQKKAIESESAPLRAERAELLKKLQPLELELKRLNEEIIAIERPRLPAICQEISGIARAMGGRRVGG